MIQQEQIEQRSATTTVMNLATGAKLEFASDLISGPRMALISAYASSFRDDKAWNWIGKYDSEIQDSGLCLLLGDFSVYKDGRSF